MTPNNNIDEMVRMAMEKGAINYDDRKRMIEALTRHGTDADEAELLLDAAIQKAEQQQIPEPFIYFFHLGNPPAETVFSQKKIS